MTYFSSRKIWTAVLAIVALGGSAAAENLTISSKMSVTMLSNVTADEPNDYLSAIVTHRSNAVSRRFLESFGPFSTGFDTVASEPARLDPFNESPTLAPLSDVEPTSPLAFAPEPIAFSAPLQGPVVPLSRLPNIASLTASALTPMDLPLGESTLEPLALDEVNLFAVGKVVVAPVENTPKVVTTTPLSQASNLLASLPVALELGAISDSDRPAQPVALLSLPAISFQQLNQTRFDLVGTTETLNSLAPTPMLPSASQNLVRFVPLQTTNTHNALSPTPMLPSAELNPKPSFDLPMIDFGFTSIEAQMVSLPVLIAEREAHRPTTETTLHGTWALGPDTPGLSLIQRDKWVFGSSEGLVLVARTIPSSDENTKLLTAEGLLIDTASQLVERISLTKDHTSVLTLATMGIDARATPETLSFSYETSQVASLNGWSQEPKTSTAAGRTSRQRASALDQGADVRLLISNQGQRSCWLSIGSPGDAHHFQIADMNGDGVLFLAQNSTQNGEDSAFEMTGWQLAHSLNHNRALAVTAQWNSARDEVAVTLRMPQGPTATIQATHFPELSSDHCADAKDTLISDLFTPLDETTNLLTKEVEAILTRSINEPSSMPLGTITSSEATPEGAPTTPLLLAGSVQQAPWAGGGIFDTVTEMLTAGAVLNTDTQIEIVDLSAAPVPSRRPVLGRYIKNSFPGAAERTKLVSLWDWNGRVVGLSLDGDSTTFVLAQDSRRLGAQESDILFQGLDELTAGELHGNGVVFTNCGRYTVPMVGVISANARNIEFTGRRPVLDAKCNAVAETSFAMSFDKTSATSTTLYRRDEDD